MPDGKLSVVLACGGRDYHDPQRIDAVLSAFHFKTPIGILIHGGASGADSLCGWWAETRGIHVAMVNALWDFHGKSAGPKRNNAMMLLHPEHIIAFPGGIGTRHMISLAKYCGSVLHRIDG